MVAKFTNIIKSEYLYIYGKFKDTKMSKMYMICKMYKIKYPMYNILNNI